MANDPQATGLITLDQAIDGALDALMKAEHQFNFYAESHQAQGKYEKAKTNRDYVFICSIALGRLQEAVNIERAGE